MLHLLPARLVVFVTLTQLALLVLLGQGRLSAQEPNRVALIVRFGEDEVTTRCVEFSEQQISGYEVLLRSDLILEAKIDGQGGLACQIEDTGCPPDDCFCQCKGGDSCIYWSYWQQSEGGWRYAQIGATSHQVSDGNVEGWSWGPGSLTDAIAPPNMTFEEVCSTAGNSGSDPVASNEATVQGLLPFAGFVVVLALLGLGYLVLRRREPQS